MASKKGVIITAGILAVITVASFTIWLVPESSGPIFVISDHREHLDGVKNIHTTIDEQMQEEFRKLTEGEISPEEYIRTAETTASQINSQIISLVESDAPESWFESYSSYIESLQTFNTYIHETIVAAEQIGNDAGQAVLDETLEKMDQIRATSESLASRSDQMRP